MNALIPTQKIGRFFLIAILLCGGAQAQIAKRDSLFGILRQKLTDSARIKLLLETSKTYVLSEAKSRDSLLTIANNIAENMELYHNKLSAFEEIGNYHLQTNSYDTAIRYYTKALELNKKLGDTLGIAAQHDNLGTAYYYKSDYKLTLYHFLERLSYCEAMGDTRCISAASNNAGLVLINLGRYEDAMGYTLKSLKIDEKNNNQLGVLSSQMSLGNINFYLKNYEKAIKYYMDIVATCEAMDNQELRIAYAYNNIASIYFQQKNFEMAGTFYDKSLVLEKQFGDKNGMALKYNNLGSVSKELGKLKEAEGHFVIALKLRKELGDLYGMASTENNLGQLYFTKGKPVRAENYYLSALRNGKAAASLEAQKIANEGLANVYEKQGRADLALKYFREYLALTDSLFDVEKAKTITELEIRYESEKKESEIALLKKNEQLQQIQLAEQQASLRANRLQRNIFIIGFVLLSLVAILVVYNYKQRLAVKEQLQKNQKETAEIRSRFFASISHEFRTPLTLISAPARQLAEKYQNKTETLGLLNHIQQNAHRLLKLINQILELSKLEAGKLELQLEHGALIAWLRIISASFISMAESKDIAFTEQFPKKEIYTLFDKDKVSQIVSNLLLNAMKFTPNGGKVEFLVTQQLNSIQITVQNTGSSITKEDQAHIFERFYQAPSQSFTTGTGIGLALVKELTVLHHGSIGVTSENDNTSFTLSLPLDETVYTNDSKIASATVDQIAETKRLASLPKKPKKLETDLVKDRPIILVVEDQDNLREYIAAQLRVSYEVKEAKHGILALEVATSEVPDIIITDLMMPEMDGEGLVEAIRSDPKTQHIPIIMLTARTEKETRLKNIGKGTDQFLTKPFEIKELKIRIKSLLEQRQRIRDYHQSQFLINPKAEAITSMNDSFLQQAGKVMANNLDNPNFSVDEFAASMGMSRVQLFRKMKAIIGYSASDFIRQYRLKKAYEYLQNKKGTVSEVAYDVGFSNLSYFTRAFKEVYHCKPSELLQKDT